MRIKLEPLILSSLRDLGGLTYDDVSFHLGAKKNSVERCMREMKRKNLIRVARYRRKNCARGGKWSPVYIIGPGVDASPPSSDSPIRVSIKKAMWKRANDRRAVMAKMKKNKGNPFFIPFASL